MTRHIRHLAGVAALAGGLLALPAFGASAQQSAQDPQQGQAPTPKKHHSVAKGAVVGALGGHMTHHRHGAIVGAAVGAEVQHHRNKKAEKAAKAEQSAKPSH